MCYRLSAVHLQDRALSGTGPAVSPRRSATSPAKSSSLQTPSYRSEIPAKSMPTRSAALRFHRENLRFPRRNPQACFTCGKIHSNPRHSCNVCYILCSKYYMRFHTFSRPSRCTAPCTELPHANSATPCGLPEKIYDFPGQILWLHSELYQAFRNLTRNTTAPMKTASFSMKLSRPLRSS